MRSTQGRGRCIYSVNRLVGKRETVRCREGLCSAPFYRASRSSGSRDSHDTQVSRSEREVNSAFPRAARHPCAAILRDRFESAGGRRILRYKFAFAERKAFRALGESPALIARLRATLVLARSEARRPSATSAARRERERERDSGRKGATTRSWERESVKTG